MNPKKLTQNEVIAYDKVTQSLSVGRNTGNNKTRFDVY